MSESVPACLDLFPNVRIHYQLSGSVTLCWDPLPYVRILPICPDPSRMSGSGLWTPIDLLRIRIQHFCSIRIRIRIQAKTELSKTISFSNFFEIKN
jgi:hypothetical protein